MKNRDLCLPCTVKLLRAGYMITKVAGGVDCKVTCAECGKRRYGGTYSIAKKGRKDE